MMREPKNCRACGFADLFPLLDLGETPLANSFIEARDAADELPRFPLRLRLCPACSLVQLAEVIDPEILYSSYAYVTSTSRTMAAHLESQCGHLIGAGNLGDTPRVVEIASNTGEYLKKFKAKGCEVLGIEPAKNIAELANAAGIPTWLMFFDSNTAKKIQADWGPADLVCGRHVFAHMDDWGGLISNLEAITHENSVVALEVPYLVDFFEQAEFDTIYHEHLSFVSVRSVEALVTGTAFRLHRVEHYPIHGGSILLQLRRRGNPEAVHGSVGEFIEKERRLKIDRLESWNPFISQVKAIWETLPALIRGLRAEGKRVIGYGASAKGNTLLNTSGVTSQDLDYIIDNTPFKQGRLAPGSKIPVAPPGRLLEDQPDYALLLAWNFAEEIINRETEYQKRGGRFIIPIPEPRVVEYAG